MSGLSRQPIPQAPPRPVQQPAPAPKAPPAPKPIIQPKPLTPRLPPIPAPIPKPIIQPKPLTPRPTLARPPVIPLANQPAQENHRTLILILLAIFGLLVIGGALLGLSWDKLFGN